MTDPLARMEAALADKLNMLPSEFRSRATRWDVVQMLAWDRTQDEKWREAYKRGEQIKKSRVMTDEEKAAQLFGGLI